MLDTLLHAIFERQMPLSLRYMHTLTHTHTQTHTNNAVVIPYAGAYQFPRALRSVRFDCQTIN